MMDKLMDVFLIKDDNLLEKIILFGIKSVLISKNYFIARMSIIKKLLNLK